jgi:hypothetical protein
MKTKLNTDNESLNWRVTKHASGLIKIETRDRVIFDGFNGEDRYAYLAAAAPAMRKVLIDCMHSMLAEGKGTECQLLRSIGEAIRLSLPPQEEYVLEDDMLSRIKALETINTELLVALKGLMVLVDGEDDKAIEDEGMRYVNARAAVRKGEQFHLKNVPWRPNETC